jgi:hypothetical protein
MGCLTGEHSVSSLLPHLFKGHVSLSGSFSHQVQMRNLLYWLCQLEIIIVK